MRSCFKAALALLLLAPAVNGQTAPQLIAPGVWFLLGEASKGYSNTIVIEMHDYLIVVDANYPSRAEQLLKIIPILSPKPVRYVFDTHHHGDHSYGNSTWTTAGVTTLAYKGVTEEINRYEPTRWQTVAKHRDDIRERQQDHGENDVQRPLKTFSKSPFVLRDSSREVRFYFLGWGHTRGDGYVWLPHERVLCTGDAAVNGPRNKLWDANLANWPRVLTKAIDLRPLHVLPGHGDPGGPEILTGQRTFLIDLYAEVKKEAAEGKTPQQMTGLHLPERDNNWIPKDLTQDISITYNEITQHKPAGAIPHVWQ
jgi:glyoxylase-like metal-dependent hydrolase (beta-lactamase superfamily II)